MSADLQNQCVIIKHGQRVVQILYRTVLVKGQLRYAVWQKKEHRVEWDEKQQAWILKLT
jgi:hypothetical protein